jgi:hypothetical protein
VTEGGTLGQQRKIVMWRQRVEGGLAVALALLCAGVSAEQGGKIRLGLELAEGESHRMKVVMDQQVNQTVMGMAQDVHQTMETIYRFDVTEVDQDGVALVKWTQESIHLSQQGPFGNVEYDSSEGGAASTPLVQGYAAMVGKEFSARIARTGAVTDVQGFDAVLEELLTDMPLGEGPQAEALRESLRGQIGDEAMADMLTSTLAIYPTEPVGIGDNWSRRVEISTGFPVITETTWTLKERRDGIAVIDVQSIVSSNADAPPLQMGAMAIRIDVAGDQTGTIEVDEATGWIVRGDVRQQLAGQASLTGAPEMEDMTWPMKIAGTITTEAL